MITQTTPAIPNYDPETGIHYGVISQHSLQPETMNDIHMEATDLSYEAAKEELIDKLVSTLDLNQRTKTRRSILMSHLSDLYSVDEDCRETADEMLQEWNSTQHDEMTTKVEDRLAVWEHVEDKFNDRYESDGSHSWLWEKDGYKLMDCLDSDVFVILSPYFTFAPQCSPCVPNAGNLDSIRVEKLQRCAVCAAEWDSAHVECLACGGTEIETYTALASDSGLKSYCLGHDFFENGEAPYPVFSVKSGKRVVMVEKPVECPTCRGRGTVTGSGYVGICNRCAGAGHTIEKVEEEQE